MSYFVVTTKHHEGFCLWDSQLTDYKVTNTPAGKDLIRPLVDAFRAEGLRVGFYHSLIDWHHPDFGPDLHHPRRGDAGFAALQRDPSRYRAYLHGQVRELLTRYGKIDYLFFDFSYAERTPAERGPTIGGRPSAADGSGAPAGGRRQRPPRDPRRRQTPEQFQPLAPPGEAAARWSGRPARPSTAPGATTATTVTSRALTCWCGC